jgi:hypothetical protein
LLYESGTAISILKAISAQTQDILCTESKTVEPIRIGISACLLGENVRYDGGHKKDPYLTDTLGQYFEYVPACPEVEYGPRA